MSNPNPTEPRNYITPAGLERLRAELRFLLAREAMWPAASVSGLYFSHPAVWYLLER
jgi:hypothetical protein